MKVCPYCSAQNQDQAAACFYCGTDLTSAAPATAPAAENPEERTQPRSTRPSDTQPMHGQRRAADPQTTYPGYPPYQQAPQPPVSPTGTQVYNEPPYAQPQYNPPPVPPQQEKRPAWPILVITLGVVLLCVGGFAIWTIMSAATNGVSWLGGRAATEAAGGIAAPTATSEAPIAINTPTPWPTFTSPPPVDTPAPPASDPASQATQAAPTIQLLTEECSSALDRLEELSGQITERPTAPLDSAWREDLTQAIADMRTHCGSLDTASPVPGIVEEAQRNLALASSEFDQATALFNEGVQNWDPGKLLQAAQHIRQASEYLGLAIEELDKIRR